MRAARADLLAVQIGEPVDAGIGAHHELMVHLSSRSARDRPSCRRARDVRRSRRDCRRRTRPRRPAPRGARRSTRCGGRSRRRGRASPTRPIRRRRAAARDGCSTDRGRRRGPWGSSAIRCCWIVSKYCISLLVDPLLSACPLRPTTGRVHGPGARWPCRGAARVLARARAAVVVQGQDRHHDHRLSGRRRHRRRRTDGGVGARALPAGRADGGAAEHPGRRGDDRAQLLRPAGQARRADAHHGLRHAGRAQPLSDAAVALRSDHVRVRRRRRARRLGAGDQQGGGAAPLCEVRPAGGDGHHQRRLSVQHAHGGLGQGIPGLEPALGDRLSWDQRSVRGARPRRDRHDRDQQHHADRQDAGDRPVQDPGAVGLIQGRAAHPACGVRRRSAHADVGRRASQAPDGGEGLRVLDDDPLRAGQVAGAAAAHARRLRRRLSGRVPEAGGRQRVRRAQQEGCR